MNVRGVHLSVDCVLMIIVLLIISLLGFLFWLENKLSNHSSSENNDFKEHMQINDDERSNYPFCEQDSAHYACSFCGRLSSTVTACSRCKTAIYCSNTCNFKHWGLGHKYECIEIEGSEDQQESPSHGSHCLLMFLDNCVTNEVEERIYEGDVYYIEGGEKSDERSLMCGNGIVNGNEGCAVCGNPSSKVCSRCKAIKYCSRTCQHFDWRSGHKFQCHVEKENSNQVVNPENSYELEDNVHSSSPLCLEFYSGSSSSRALIPTSLSQEETKNSNQKEVEEQLRSLKEELTKIKDENKWLQSERDEWEVRTRNSIDRLYSFRKENEHQLFILKHENELMSNAEKKATQMVNSLSQRVQCLQIAVESGVEERQKQEEYIHMLQNDCAKLKIELQEQKKCVKRLTLELDKTKLPVRVTEDTRQKLVDASTEFAAVESNAAAAEGCMICLANEKNMAFGCGHMTCFECGSKIRKCHICRRKITNRIKLFPD
ncbi:hypothetical protein ACSQ67_024071 [Phaseolus vulgaris]